jgi:hypothetical protein
VVNRELVQVGLRELTGTAPADPGIQLQGLPAVALLTLIPCAACVGDDAIESADIGSNAFAGRHAKALLVDAKSGDLEPAAQWPLSAVQPFAVPGASNPA